MRTNGVVRENESPRPLRDQGLKEIEQKSNKRNSNTVLPKNQPRVEKPTHTQIADDFVQENKGHLMFSHGEWFLYGGGFWQHIHEQVIEARMWEHIRSYEAGGVRPTMSMYAVVQRYAKANMFVEDEKINNYPSMINMQNGVFDLELGKLFPHSPEYYFTSQLPYSYEPNAERPTFERFKETTFIDPVTGEYDPELADFVQEALGYSLTLDYKHHVMFWAIGTGSNGKGVWFQLLQALVGKDGSIPLNIDILKKEQYQVANLEGKRMAFCAEANATSNVVQDGLLKQIVAGDVIQARMISQKPFSLQPRVKIWWSMNKVPIVADTSYGFWRRVKIIPFNAKFPEGVKDLYMFEKLSQELSGIFNWALEGLTRLERNGRFTQCRQVEVLTAQHKRDSNHLNQFIEDECVEDYDATYASSEIYAVYREWCTRNGCLIRSNRTFKDEMTTLGYTPKRTSSGVFYQGVGPRSNTTWGLS